MTFTIQEFVLQYVGLLAIFSPVAAIVPFISIAGNYPRNIQRKFALRAAVISCLFLLVGSWAGQYLLRFLGITIPALRTAGGLILILSAIPMVMKGNSPRRQEVDPVDTGTWKTMVVVPIVFPFTIGAASLSYVITLMGTAQSPLDYLGITAVILLDGLSIWLTYFVAGPLSKRISKTGNDILVRIGGIIVLALGFMILTQGLKELLPGLG